MKIDITHNPYETGSTLVKVAPDFQIISTLQRTNIQDLLKVYDMDIVKELGSILSDELSKTIDKQIIKNMFEETLEERKKNIWRKIVLGKILDEPPNIP